jgi:uncharacterized membrane protein
VAPLVVLFGSLLVLRASGALGARPLQSWTASARGALAVMLLFTASAHFVPGLRADLVRMVPPAMGNAGAWVTITGLAEIAGAIGLLVPGTRRVAGLCLVLLMLALFPANVRAAREGLDIGGSAATPLPLRAAMQVLFIAWTIWVSQARTAQAAARRRRREPSDRSDAAAARAR